MKNKLMLGFLALCMSLPTMTKSLHGQISFSGSDLLGETLDDPTSLAFGPDQKLYVAQQDGTIFQYTVERDTAAPGNGTYFITNTEVINEIIENTPNHNDDGTSNSTKKRQVTGILTAGTASNPILYVTSSDWRIGGGGSAGNDKNLDTNSGLISRLTWNGASWDRVDLVRGLPRCEENHATNGLEFFKIGTTDYLFVQQGGNANSGAPSNNFAGTSEMYLSAALLKVNLTQLESMPIYTDPRNGIDYVYDLPTLNDPDRIDIAFGDAAFPYTDPNHPLHNATIDLGDPFGGNNGLNQAFSENGGPVQIFSPGYRNAYDVVVTANGEIYTQDNGPNGGWGGAPLIYDASDNYKGTHYTGATYDPAAGDYITNEFNVEGGSTIGDAFHYVGNINDADGTYYAGHPAPIRAFPSRAGVYKYEYNGSNWVATGSYDWANLLVGASGYFNASFSIADFPDDPRQGEYLYGQESSDKINVLDVVGSSTNGMCEYTASNFGGILQGSILSASFSGKINRYLPLYDAQLDEVLLSIDDGNFLSGFGQTPLDIIAMGDTDPFPGTIWVATYGANNVTVFEPFDFGNCYEPGDPEYDPLADYDGDGFTNADEIASGTNYCSGGSKPNDNDGDFISDLLDADDDNDNILDLNDVYAIDPDNGTTTTLPIQYPFWNNDPGTGFFGLGFTGLMLDPNGATDYLTQFDLTYLSPGGAGGKMTADAVPSGDALQDTQQNAFQFGFNLDGVTSVFTIHSKIVPSFTTFEPLEGQSVGIFVGTGDQDNYFKVILNDGIISGDSINGIQTLVEDASVVRDDVTYDIAGLNLQEGQGTVDLYISIDPATGNAQAYYSTDSGETILSVGGSIALPLPANFWSGTDPVLATGIISTSGNSGQPFIATWDYIDITEDQAGVLELDQQGLDFGSSQINGSVSQLTLEIKNLGGPASGSIDITNVAITGTDAGLFSASATLPLTVGAGAKKLIPVTFTPDAVEGTKSATLEITHNGANSPNPLTVPLNAVLTDIVSLLRINAAGGFVTATDGGPDWAANGFKNDGPGDLSDAQEYYSYFVNTGKIETNTGVTYANRHVSSIPDYIDEATFNAIFNNGRWDAGKAPEMEFTIPVPNGDFIVNLYMVNGYEGTQNVGDRIFDILLEGVVAENDLDLVATFGHQVGGMLSYSVTVTDGFLNISFGHVVENPLVNAIEIRGSSILPLDLDPIDDQSNDAGQSVSLSVSSSGGFANETTSYTASGLPAGLSINSASGEISGTIDANAFTGGTNQDGIHSVTVVASKPSSLDSSESFTWTVLDPSINQLPTAAASYSANLLEVTFDGSASTDPDGSIVDYAWDFGDGNGNTYYQPTYTYTYAAAGTYTATLTVTDDQAGTDTVTFAVTVIDGSVSASAIRINVGGAEYTDPATTNVWAADEYFSGGSIYSNGNAILNTELDTLYQSERYGAHSYAIPVQNAEYIVNLHFAEIYSGANSIGARVFDVNIEGVLELDDYDIFSQAGALNTPVVETFIVTVTDALLNIELIQGVQNPKLSAIEIINAGPQPLALNPIADQTNYEGDISNLAASTTGGDTEVNVTYGIAGQPTGIDIEPTNGQIYGTIAVGAATGGPAADGVHSVTVTAYEDIASPVTTTFDWTVLDPNANQLPQASFTHSSNLLEVAFNSTSTDPDGTIASYAWNFGDGSSSTEANPTYTYAAAGTYTVTLTVTDDDGDASNPAAQEDITVVDTIPLVWSDLDEDENYTGRHECSFVQAGDKFYLFGGRESPKTLDIYDYITNSWTSIQDSAPIDINHAQAVEYQGLIWIIGAFKTNSYPNETPADYIWSFNPATQEWIQGPEIPESRKRGSTGLVVYNDKFYVVAGNTLGHKGGFVAWFDEYDPATGVWTVLNDAPTARDHFHAVIIEGKLYAASGRQSNHGGPGGTFENVISEVDVYDFATGTWSTLPNDQNIPTPRAGSVVANFKDKLIVAGGETPSAALTITEIYDPVTQSWFPGLNDDPINLNHPRHGTQGLVSGDGLFTISGSPKKGGGNQTKMEVYGLNNPVGSPSVASALSADSTINFASGETKPVTLDVSGGNVGIIVTSMQLTGADAAEFSIDSGELTKGLIRSNSQHTVTVSYNGTELNKSAALEVYYNNNNSSQIINLTVVESNPAPVANADSETTVMDIPVTLNVLDNDSYVAGETPVISIQTNTTNGSVFTNDDNTVTYIPNSGFVGADSFTYTITDSNGVSNVATVNISLLSSPNSAPVAQADSVNVDEDSSIVISVLANDSDANGDTLTISAVVGGANGTTVINTDNTITYTPQANFNGSDSFTYTVVDGNGGSDTAVVSVTVNPVNDLPEAEFTFTIDSLTVDVDGSPSSDVDGVNAITTYAWDFGDGNTATGLTASHTYAAAGSYTVTLTVTDDNASTGDSTQSVEVYEGVTGFTLVNAGNDSDIIEIADGMEINIHDIEGLDLSIRADSDSTENVVESMQLTLVSSDNSVNYTGNESLAPYALFGDTNGNYNSGNIPAGTYTLTATAYSENSQNGDVVGSKQITFSIVVPSITIDSPQSGATVSSDFAINFTVENWVVGVGLSHIHVMLDGNYLPKHESLDPIQFTGLAPGEHTIMLTLADANHVETSYSAMITVTVQ